MHLLGNLYKKNLNQINPCSRILTEMLVVAQSIKICFTLYTTSAVPSLQGSTGPYSEPEESNQHPPPFVWFKTISTLSSHLHLILPSGIFPSGFLCKILHALSSLQYPIHLILQYLISCTNYKASHYAVFFILLLFLL